MDVPLYKLTSEGQDDIFLQDVKKADTFMKSLGTDIRHM